MKLTKLPFSKKKKKNLNKKKEKINYFQKMVDNSINFLGN